MIRFQSEFKSSRGTLYRISILDADHTGSVTTVKVADAGFVLKYDGENQERTNPILPSRCSVGILIENSTDESVISDLIGSAEGRFSIKIEKHNGTTYDLFWFGNVLPDIGQIEDISFPFVIELSATDGLATLQDVDYNNNGTAYTGDVTLLEHIQNCLNKIQNTSEAWLSSDIFLETAINWFEENHTTGLNDDPLAMTYIDHRAFTEYDNNGEPVFQSCYDVLVSILTTFMARMYMDKGRYVIEQINERVQAATNVRKYNYDDSFNSASSDSYEKLISQTSTPARLGGGTYTFYPPLKSVIVTYNANNSKNFAEKIALNASGTTALTLNSPVQSGAKVALSATATTQLVLGMDIELRGIYAGTPSTSQTINFQVEVELEIKVGNRWLRRDFSNSYYSTPKWTTAQGNYVLMVDVQVITAPISGTFTWYAKPSFLFTSPDLSEGGTLQIGADVTTQDTRFQLTSFDAQALRAFVVYDGAIATEDDLHEYTASVSTNSIKKLEISTLLGDGTSENSAGRLKRMDGSDLVDTVAWRLGSSSTVVPISQFLANTVLAGQDTAVRKYLGTLYGDLSARNRIYWVIKGVTTAFLFNGGTFDAKLDHWQGEWFVIKSGSFGITTSVRKYRGGLQISNAGGVGSGSGLSDYENIRPPVFGGTALPQAFSLFSGASTSALVSAGSQTTLSVNEPLSEDAFPNGSTIYLVDPLTGNSQPLTVAAAISAGDTSITVTGTTDIDFPENSYIVYPQSEVAQQSGGGLPSGGADKHYTHVQSTPASTWTITHNLEKKASVVVEDSAGSIVEGSISWPSLNQVNITFSAAFSGSAFLN